MLRISKYFLAAYLILNGLKSFAQQELDINSIPKNYYLNPLDIKLNLAGSFGEIRTNHFHSGLDIKTNQREGYPVYATADGHISRIRVQVGGFGYALYIDHPNGTTSVYAHLQKFNPKIALFLKNQQYKLQSFAVDFPLTPIEIPVKKGEIIAYSGNTGSSGGPHLHFEIRNTKTEQTINPLMLGIKVDDHIKPTITSLYLYNVDDNPFSEKTKKQQIAIAGGNGNYRLAQSAPLNVSGRFAFGIGAYDTFDGNANKNGLFGTRILLDGTCIFETVIDQFYFDHTRSVNAYIDYPTKFSLGRTIEKGFALPGAKTSFYKNMINYGLIELKDQDLHEVQYILSDYNGNESILKFNIRSSSNIIPEKAAIKGRYFNYLLDNKFENEEVIAAFPRGIFYDDLDFEYSKSLKSGNTLSNFHQIHNRLTPLHSNFELQIKLSPEYLDLKDKIVVVNAAGNSQGGEYVNGYIKAFPRAFDKFFLRADTTAPRITPLNITNGANLFNTNRVSFKISDNLSGIKTFDGYIDDQWVLMEYEPRTSTIWHNFERDLKEGKHSFKVVVSDLKNNISTVEYNFTK